MQGGWQDFLKKQSFPGKNDRCALAKGKGGLPEKTALAKMVAGYVNEPERGLCVSLDVAYDVADGEKLFCFVIRNFNAEFFFKRHYELDGIEGIGTEVFDEFCVGGDLVSAHAELLHNDIFYTIFDALI